MCESWRRSFAAFYSDIGPCPPGMSLDRIDVNGDYEPGNCRWATALEQANNARSNILIAAGGRRMTLAQAARLYGIPYTTLHSRVWHGQKPEEALNAILGGAQMRSGDLSLLYPPFRMRVEELLHRLERTKLPFYVFEALRTFEDQEALYAQGRTKPGKIVTNARPGESLHSYGLAVDLVLDGMPEKPGIQWSWDTKADFNADGRSDWMNMGEIAESCGLEWGGRWKRFPDLPHLQMTCGLTLAEIREIYRECSTLTALWSELKAA
jgi:hypothetical protein